MKFKLFTGFMWPSEFSEQDIEIAKKDHSYFYGNLRFPTAMRYPWHEHVDNFTDMTDKEFREHKLLGYDGRTQYEKGWFANVNEEILFACGDTMSASHYARGSKGAIASFTIDSADVEIDDIDSFARIFQHCHENVPLAQKWLVHLLGKRVMKFFPDSDRTEFTRGREDYNLGQCIYAMKDQQLAINHYKSQTVIYGRRDVRFRNAFKMRLEDIEPRSIKYHSPSDRYPDFDNCKKSKFDLRKDYLYKLRN